MAYITGYSTGQNSLYVYIAGLDSSYQYSDRVCTYVCSNGRSGTATIAARVSSGGGYSFTGLTANTTYNVSVTIHVPSGGATPNNYISLGPVAITTDAPPTPTASVAFTGIGENYFTAYVTGLDSSYSYADRTCTWYLNNVYKGVVNLSAGISSGGYYQFYGEGVAPSTTYTVKAEIYVASSGYTLTITGSVTTARTSCVAWDWSISNGSNATQAQTVAGHTALVNRGYVTSFPYQVWNDIVDKIASVRSIKGVPSGQSPWSSVYLTQAATKMTASDRTLTATRYNSAKYNIGSVFPTGIADKYSGDPLLATDITNLTAMINAWIVQR